MRFNSCIVVMLLCALSQLCVVHASTRLLARAEGPTKRILLEEFSTAPCGFCPEGDIIAAKLMKEHPQVIWVTHHAGFGTDSMTAPESVTIANAFTTFAPGAAINRGDYKIPTYTIAPWIAVSRQKWDSVCATLYDQPAIVDVHVDPFYDETKRQLKVLVSLKFNSVPDSGDIRVNAFVVEDSVVGYGKGYDQKNYFNTTPGHVFYQKGDSIYGYQHHRVVRKALSGAWGLAGKFTKGIDTATYYTMVFDPFTIPKSWNDHNLDIIGYVGYHHDSASKRQIINVNNARIFHEATAVDDKVLSLSAVQLFPLPIRDQLHYRLHISNGSSVRAEVVSIEGRVLGNTQLQNTEGIVPFDEFQTGSYVVRFWQNDRMIESRVVCVVRE